MFETPSSLAAFFHEHLTAAREALSIPLDPSAEHYVVMLLVRLAQSSDEPPMHVPLVLQWRDALDEPRTEARFVRFRSMGDSALIRRGLFPEEYEARGLRSGYFDGLGRQAYAEAARAAPGGLRRAGIFEAMADSFGLLARLLLDLRERVREDDEDVVRLAAAVRRSDSVEAARRLASLGLSAGRPIDSIN